ncbi:MAG: HPF/RaiA family ribosome-associated protein [Methylococcales bacterium]|nr:HPF/RaiA family ribosome-associated protein [Methylococcales bacterium]
MQIPLQITFRGISHSDAIEARIREKANKLNKFFTSIMSCRVAVEAEHQRHHHGNQYHIRIDITTPHKELVISREHYDRESHENIYVAIRDAFNAATRQLEDYSRIQRGEVKIHNLESIGTILRLLPEKDHGFIQSEEGREIYFHRNSVAGKGFNWLAIGDKIRYVEEDDDLGPQASIVYP